MFIDRAELPSSTNLAAGVRTALEESAALIVICSVAAAQSRWVNEEVLEFKRLGRADGDHQRQQVLFARMGEARERPWSEILAESDVVFDKLIATAERVLATARPDQ